VQPALAGQRLLQFALAAQQTKQRIRAQLLVIVQVFVAQCQAVNALRQHLLDPVFDPLRIPGVLKTGRQAAQQMDPALHLTQQQRPSVAR